MSTWCEQGAELVELRLDYISSRVNIQRLLKDRPCPTVITVRREQDGGKYTGSEEARLIMLREAIANGVEYVDLEDDIAGKIPRFGKTKRIISYHSFRNTPDNLRELHARLQVARRRHRQDRHDGQPAARQSARAGDDAGERFADDRHVHGRHRHAVADSGPEVRRAVHVRHVSPRAGARAGPAQLRADGERLSAQQHQAGRRPCTA